MNLLMLIIFFLLLFVILILLIIINCKGNSKESLDLKKLHGNSHRLGNLIDAWYFGSLGSKERVRHFNHMHPNCSNQSFGKFLKIKKSLGNNYHQKDLDTLVGNSDKFWAVYDYDNIMLSLPFFQKALCYEMDKYEKYKRKHEKEDFDCVIHMRTGDFIRLNQVIDPQYLAKACAEICDPHDKIGIVDGGTKHGIQNNVDIISKSNMLKEKLINELEKLGLSNITTFGSDPDTDFFNCAKAPKLVTAGGSFAICAAIANRNGIIRTPACKNINFCRSHGTIEPKYIHKKWKTYSYETIDFSKQ